MNKNIQSQPQKAAEIFVNKDWNMSQAAVPLFPLTELSCCVWI